MELTEGWGSLEEYKSWKRRHLTKTFFIVFILFSIISFAGWLWETLYFLVKYSEILNRGFLILPWCPIYGFSIIGIYLLMGTPDEPHGILNKFNTYQKPNKFLIYSIYFILSAIIPSILELCVGIFFESVFDQVLWSYEGNILTITKYVCLWISIIWGLAITFCMRFVFNPLKNLFYDKVNTVNIVLIGGTLLALFGTDIIISFLKAFNYI